MQPFSFSTLVVTANWIFSLPILLHSLQTHPLPPFLPHSLPPTPPRPEFPRALLPVAISASQNVIQSTNWPVQTVCGRVLTDRIRQQVTGRRRWLGHGEKQHNPRSLGLMREMTQEPAAWSLQESREERNWAGRRREQTCHEATCPVLTPQKASPDTPLVLPRLSPKKTRRKDLLLLPFPLVNT